jgi:hypothetical protein
MRSFNQASLPFAVLSDLGCSRIKTSTWKEGKARGRKLSLAGQVGWKKGALRVESRRLRIDRDYIVSVHH